MSSPATRLELALESEVDGAHDQEVTNAVVPLWRLSKNEKCKDRENDQRYDLLQYLERPEPESNIRAARLPSSRRWRESKDSLCS